MNVGFSEGRHHCNHCSVMLMCSFYIASMWPMLLWVACSSDHRPKLWFSLKVPKCICASLLPSFLRDQGHSHLMCYEHFHHLFVGQSCQGTLEMLWCAMPHFFGLHMPRVSFQRHQKMNVVVDNPSLDNTYILRRVVTISSMLWACHSNDMKLIWKVQLLSQVQPSCQLWVYVQYTHITNTWMNKFIPIYISDSSL